MPRVEARQKIEDRGNAKTVSLRQRQYRVHGHVPRKDRGKASIVAAWQYLTLSAGIGQMQCSL